MPGGDGLFEAERVSDGLEPNGVDSSDLYVDVCAYKHINKK